LSKRLEPPHTKEKREISEKKKKEEKKRRRDGFGKKRAYKNRGSTLGVSAKERKKASYMKETGERTATRGGFNGGEESLRWKNYEKFTSTEAAQSIIRGRESLERRGFESSCRRGGSSKGSRRCWEFGRETLRKPHYSVPETRNAGQGRCDDPRSVRRQRKHERGRKARTSDAHTKRRPRREGHWNSDLYLKRQQGGGVGRVNLNGFRSLAL